MSTSVFQLSANNSSTLLYSMTVPASNNNSAAANTFEVSDNISSAPISSITVPTLKPNSNTAPAVASYIIVLVLFGGLLLISIVAFIAGKLMKDPKIKTKFTRKNSYGTLYTVNQKGK